MGCGKHLVEGENVLVIKEIAKGRTNKSIAGRINRCVMTEIGESDVNRMSGATSGIISNESRLPDKAQTIRNHTFGILTSTKSMIKIPFCHLGRKICAWNGRENA